MASILQRIILLLAGLCLFILVGLNTLFPGDDPYRCRATLDTGRWTDILERNGSRWPFQEWQPTNCLLHKYNADDIHNCLEGRHVLFSGDEAARQAAWGMARLLDRKKANQDREKIRTPSWTVTYAGTKIRYHSNPALEVDKLLLQELETIRSEAAHPVPVKEQEGAAFIMLGAARSFGKRDEGGVKQVDKYKAAVSNISEILGPRADFASAPLDPADGIGNQVFFQPPAYPYGPNIYGLKAADKEIAEKHVGQMHAWLREQAEALNFPLLWSFLEMHANENRTYYHRLGDFTYDVIDAVAENKARVLLNLRCNAKWDQHYHKRMGRTCCISYGGKSPVQRGLVLAGMLYLLACVAGEALDLVGRRGGAQQPRWRLFNMETGAVVLAVLMCYFADRTQMLGKEGRVWQGWGDLFVFCLPGLVLGLATIRKARSPAPKPGGHLAVEAGQQPFLSRDITDEWKGWMQVAILVYHWTRARADLGVHIFIRLAVGAYLFQTGYNHTTFFLLKKDYSFRRFAAVMIRLNLLSAMLAFFMDVSYLGYYFAPLCSFWFAVVWLTLYIGHKRMNDNTQLVLAKIAISAIVVPPLLHWTSGVEWFSWITRAVFNLWFSASVWQFRTILDMLVVYFGMLLAVANLRMKRSFGRGLRIALGVLSVIAVGVYWHICARYLNTEDLYHSWHPYIEVIPIMAYVVLRNISASVRNYSSRAMIWVGKCSLELYILQGHLFVAGDYHGLLVIDGLEGRGLFLGRWKSLLALVPVFFWISSQAATSTGRIANLILGTPTTPQPIARRNPAPGEEKDDNDDPDDSPLLGATDSGSRGRSRSAVRRCVPLARITIESPQARVGVCLVVMWALNVLNR